MAGKFVPLVISGILLFSISVPLCLADEDAEINKQKENIYSLIEKGKFSEAKTATEKMTIEFPGLAKLPDMLYWIARRYQHFDRFEDAKQIYEQIIRDFPDSPWAKKAKMGSAMTEAISLVVSGKFAEAKVVTAQMATDFAGNPDLAETFFWIAERYERQARLEDAKRNYQRLMEQFPNHLYAKKAKLAISRAEVIALIETGDFNKAEIALNKMTADFAEDSDLPWSLYLIGQRYESKGKQEDANSVFQHIMKNYPDNIYASKVAIEKRILAKEGTENTVVKYVNLNPDLEKAAIEIYRVARGFEEANDFNSAQKAYEQVVKDYNATIKGGNAVLDIRRLEILQALDSNEANLADILLAQYVKDFNQNSYAGDCLDLLVDKCYWSAFELRKQNKHQQANRRFAFAENILQLIIDKKTAGYSTIGNTDTFEALYFYAAGCRQLQGKWEKSIVYLQKVVDDYPNYKNACNAQVAIGWCYEALRDRENLPKEAINPLIEEAYKAALDKYPDCNMAASAAYRLGELSIKKGDKVNAIVYYKKFLELAMQGDRRIETVKAKEASLEESK
jgi:TolA-binding protein